MRMTTNLSCGRKKDSLTHIVLTTNTIIIIKCVRNLLVLSLNVSNFCQLVLN
jgi:hypothetical protein